MRIGIDVRYLSHGLFGGVHTYVAHFVPELIRLAPEHEFILYADTKRPFELRDLPPNAAVRYLPYRNALSSVVNDFSLGRRSAGDQLDIMHHPANYGFGPANARAVITLHDALNILPLSHLLTSNGSPRTPRMVVMTVYLHYCTWRALRNASLLLTVSEHAKGEIQRISGYSPERILPAPHAPTPDLRRVVEPQALAAVREHHNLRKRFVLADALKNPAVIVRAWLQLPASVREAHEIVFFSRRPDPLPVVFEAVEQGVARLLIRPSRNDLIALYSQAAAFVFPSWYEGFGIPILEAMTCGAPVIASDRTSIPEVAGGAALLMDAEDDHTLVQHLTRVLSEPSESERLRQLGFARAAQFSWRSTAQRILRGYQLALAGQN
jgi:glycosyltransferase involved in cell wall biosynthesis